MATRTDRLSSARSWPDGPPGVREILHTSSGPTPRRPAGLFGRRFRVHQAEHVDRVGQAAVEGPSGDIEQLEHLDVPDPVDHGRAASLRDHDVAASQNAPLLRDRRLGRGRRLPPGQPQPWPRPLVGLGPAGLQRQGRLQV